VPALVRVRMPALVLVLLQRRSLVLRQGSQNDMTTSNLFLEITF
jgi:hypothetical protein